jgi:tRNA (mo5U34)-methyltransferase
MSVMLLDCSRLDWDVEKIVDGLDQERYDYQQLMFELCIVAPGEIADRIPPEWNCLEWFEPGRSKLVHYTVVPTQPWKNDENPLRSIWEASYVEAVRAGAVQAKEVLAGIRAGFLKPSLADAFAPEALSQAAEELKVPQLSARTAWRAAQSVRRRIGRLVRAPLAGIQRRLAPNQRRTPRNSPSAFFAESRKVALARQPAVEGMIPLTDLELQGFQTALDWKTGLQLPDGRLLGVAGKRGKVSVGVDPRVQLVADRLQPRHKHILELGCCEGIHTVQLARICRHVTALEVRPSNIACALVRLFVHDVHNATVKLWDVRDLDESFGRFEILFHVGVLYHLIDPVEHLFRIRELANELVLDTHVCLDDTRFPRADVTYDGRTYRAHLYEGESGWFERFSGLEPNSRWLHRDALLQVLRDAGFATADLVDERIERNGPRVTLLARRTGAALGQADGQPRQQGLAAA